MQTINTPLTLGQTGQEVAKLQEALMYFMSSGAITVSDEQLINGLADEYAAQLFGHNTATLVRQFQSQHGLSSESNPVLDDATRISINATLSQLQANGIRLSGAIRFPAGAQAHGPFEVTLRRTTLGAPLQLGTLISTDGSYAFSFSSAEAAAGKAKGYQVTAVDAEGTTYSSAVSYLIGTNIHLDIIPDQESVVLISEYQEVRDALENLLAGQALASVSPDDEEVSRHLVAESGEPADNVRLLLQAASLSETVGYSNMAVLYGLFRQGIKCDIAGLLLQPADYLKRALTIAVSGNIVPNMEAQDITDAITALLNMLTVHLTQNVSAQSPESSATFRILQGVFNYSSAIAIPVSASDVDTRAFMQQYFSFDSEAGGSNFWTSASDNVAFADFLNDLKAAISLSILCGNNPALVYRLLHLIKGEPLGDDPSIGGNSESPDAKLLARLDKNGLLNIITRARTSDTASFFYPAYVSGETNEIKDDNYATRLVELIAHSFPTQSIASKLSATGGSTPFITLSNDLDTFLANNVGFDLRSTPAHDLSLNLTGIEHPEAFVSELGSVQRLMNLTPDYEHITAMAAEGYTSAISIVQGSKADFAAKMADTMDIATAGSYYRTAKGIADFNATVLIEKYKDFIGLDRGARIIDATTYDPEIAYAEWRTLFGSLDGCNCCSCQSVYSASAYMTDLLRFLSGLPNGPDIHDELVSHRRPDLPHIELTCKNANTPVPQIDIANELLEDLVADNTGRYKMYARQTGADAAIQRAIPEHVNTSGVTLNVWDPLNSAYTTPVTLSTPYAKLKNAIYPWSLPYNFYKRQIDEHLKLSGGKSYEIVQRFSSNDRLNAWSDYGFCTEYLGLSKDEADLLTTDPSTSSVYLPAMYGFKVSGSSITPIPDPAKRGFSIGGITITNWVNTLAGRVDIFLQQTGLAFAELLQLVDCYFINPLTAAGATTRKMIIRSKSGKDEDTCNLDELEISGMDINVLYLLYRFVRLKRGLGWTYYELDRVLMAMGITSPYALAPAQWLDRTNSTGQQHYYQLAQISYVVNTLGLHVEEAAALRIGIDERPYRNYDKSEPSDIPSLYERIFRNPALFDVNAPGYPFRSIASANGSEMRDVLENYISGILNIPGAVIRKLLTELAPGSGTIIPDLSLLSKIYREVLLIKSLKLSVENWLIYKHQVTDVVNFGADGVELFDKHVDFVQFYPPQMIRLINFIRAAQESGLNGMDIDYVLQDRPVSETIDEQLNASLAEMLTKLRAALKQKWMPGYNPATDLDGKGLMAVLTGISNADKASTLTAIVQDTARFEPGYTVADGQSIVNTDFRFLLPVDSDRQLIYSVDPSMFLTSAQDRRSYVFSKASKYMLDSFIVGFFSKELNLEEGMVRTILEDCVLVPNSIVGQTQNGLQAFAQQDFITDLSNIERWGSSGSFYAAPFKSLLLLYKAGILITKLGLSDTDVNYFWKSPNAFTEVLKLSDLPLRTQPNMPPPFGPAPYRKLNTLLRWIRLSRFLGKDASTLYSALNDIMTAATVPLNVPASLLSIIGGVFKTGSDDIATLLGDGGITSNGVFNVWQPFSYEQPQLYMRIIDALEMQYLLPAPMQALAKVSNAIHTAANQQDANEIIRIIKAQYDDKQWLEVIQPVNDVLRMERRNALVAYLLANPPAGYEYSWHTTNDIFETLMLDVEMNPCMSTTRVLMGINTIQLWVDRVLLSLERLGTPPVVLLLDKDSKRQWDSWRKRYRIWEANRKIFIYPENWIEPDLRDGKTPLFIELEKSLKQNEVTAENVEAAYSTYLERLDELAHLEIIGIYRETKQEDYSNFMYFTDVTQHDIIHAFGRTPAHPHIYYYRKRVADEWTPWEKMDVQIDGDHFIPVMWRGRLRFYWLLFTKDQEQTTATRMRSQDPDDKYIPPPAVRWKIQLAWTELKDGRWTAKQISKASLHSRYILEEKPKSAAHVTWFANHYDRMWNFEGDLERIRREYINFFCDYEDGNLRFRLTEQWHSMNSGYLNHLVGAYTTSSGLKDFKIDTISDIIQGDEKYMDGWDIPFGSFNVQFNGVLAVQELSEYQPYVSLYSDIPSWPRNDLPHNNYKINNTDYWYRQEPEVGYNHFPDGNIPLLGLAPGDKHSTDWIENVGEKTGYQVIFIDRHESKYLVFPRTLTESYVPSSHIEIPYFFYKDRKNTYFVEKIHEVGTYTGELQFEPTGPDTVILTPEDGFDLGIGRHPYSSWTPVDAGGGATGGIFGTNTYYITKYRFHNFRHERVNAFRRQLHEKGLEGLLNRQFIQDLNNNEDMDFAGRYLPTTNVLAGKNYEFYPTNGVDFRYDSAYAAYNWELFFHIPMLIASRLSQNQQFEDARKWYHYVFNPTVAGNAGAPATTNADFWNVENFYQAAFSIPTNKQIMQDSNLAAAVQRWADNPFKPHLVARTRISAYMKNVVMKYLDNLIAWGDALFRTDSRENIVEATLLYVLAAQLLGRKPTTIPARAKPVAQTYASMIATASAWNAFANALVKIESILLASGTKPTPTQLPVDAQMYYFCIPLNDRLTTYWNTIADRLFKIRNCRSIEGIERDLALYDPPIDPALLVKAAASGVSVVDAIAGLLAPMPQYRFNVLSQKATELTGEVKALGGQLLSALEKKDAEHLALLRGTQEQKVLNAVTELKVQGIEEAVAQINGLQQQQKNTILRRDYYKGLIDQGLNSEEQLQLKTMQDSIPLHIAEGAMRTLSSIMYMIPEVHIGPFILGVREGGANLGHLVDAGASVLNTISNVNSTVGSMAATKGSFIRRRQDWELQVKLAEAEIKQIDKQIIAAQIRQAMTEHELNNHKLQISNAQEMDEAMRSKYTNEELYDWMIGQVSFSYIAAYKLAYDVAKRAERCYQYELSLPLASFIGYEYWDSLRKGLLAGEGLAHDIKRMEVSYMEKNKRHLELTKHISLATFAPNALMTLKTNKECSVSIPEWLYDMDYPGQHMRRIKSVSVSIPCVAGPYTTVSCKLSLLKSQYRKDGNLNDTYAYGPFEHFYGNIQSIATSHAQNDSGMFDFSFRDERYLPFEGAGAISEWKIELPATYAQFDYDSISDVIIHINYTALDEGNLKTDASSYVKSMLKYDSDASYSGIGFMRLFNLRHEFPNEWHAASTASAPLPSPVKIKLHQDLFPFYTSGKSISMVPGFIRMKVKQGVVANDYTLLLGYTNDTGSIVKTPYSFVATSNDKYAVYKLSTATPPPAPILSIDDNVRILKVYLEDSNGQPVNIGSVAEDINLVTINYLRDYQKKADDADWEDYPIPTGMEAWWKADAGIAISGTHITGWEDQSGHGHDLTPLSLSTGPLVDTGLIRGVAPIVFNNSHALYSGAFNDSQDFTIATLVKAQSTYTTGILGRNSSSAYLASWCVWIFGNNYRIFSVSNSGANPPHANCTATINSGWQLLLCRRDAVNGTFKIWLNGTLIRNLTCGNSFIQSNQPISIGALQDNGSMFYGDFKMLESVIYNRALSDGEIDDCNGYFKNRYNLF